MSEWQVFTKELLQCYLTTAFIIVVPNGVVGGKFIVEYGIMF